ncbi:MAG: TonB-dependent receptor [Thiotrichaceae bacterium]
MNKRIYFWILWFLIGNFPIFAIANEKQAMTQLRDLSLEQLMEVSIVTASKHEETIDDTPSTVIVVTREQIQRRHYVNLLDLLRDLPGTDLQKNNHQVEYNTFTLRGHVSSNKFLILQDGVRITSPTGEAIPIADNFPLYYAKRVEVLYGPAAALYGADAFGGVINIISETLPEETTLTSSVGSENYQYYSLHGGKQLTDKLSLTVGGHLQRANLADLANDFSELNKVDAVTFGKVHAVSAQDRADFTAPVKSHSLFAKLQYDKNFTLGFNQSLLRQPSTTNEKPQSTLYGAESIWSTELNTVYARYHTDINENLSTETLLNYATYEVAPTSKFKNIYVDFNDAYIYARGEKQGIEQQFDYQFNQDHHVILGLSYEKFHSVPKTTDLPRPFDKSKSITEQNMYHIGTNDTLPIEFTELDYDNQAAYLQLQSRWNKRFSTTLGVRYDANSRYQSTLNPRLGLVYKLQPRTVLKLLYGESFRAPSPMDSYEFFGIFSGKQNDNGEYVSSYFRAPSTELQPEKARNLEFNLTHQIHKNLNFSLSGYYIRLSNLIRSMADTEPKQFIPDGQILSTDSNQNLFGSNRYGIDFSVNYQTTLGKHWRAEFWGNYSFIDGSMGEPTATTASGELQANLPYVAKHKFKLGGTFSYDNQFIITPKLYFIDNTHSFKLNSRDQTQRLEVPEYAVLDVYFGVDNVMKNLSAGLSINNVLDNHYYNVGGGSSANFLKVPQLSRSLAFSLQYRF